MCKACHFHWKGQCASEIQLLNAWSTSLSPREADDVDLAQFDFTRSVSHKNWHAHFRDRGWRRLRYLPQRWRSDMATETVVALDSNFKLLLKSRILVAVEKMVASGYNRDQTWLCVYCWCQTPSAVLSPRGETTPSGVWYQQYTHNHFWSLKHCIHGYNNWYRYIFKSKIQ